MMKYIITFSRVTVEIGTVAIIADDQTLAERWAHEALRNAKGGAGLGTDVQWLPQGYPQHALVSAGKLEL